MRDSRRRRVRDEAAACLSCLVPFVVSAAIGGLVILGVVCLVEAIA